MCVISIIITLNSLDILPLHVDIYIFQLHIDTYILPLHVDTYLTVTRGHRHHTIKRGHKHLTITRVLVGGQLIARSACADEASCRIRANLITVVCVGATFVDV